MSERRHGVAKVSGRRPPRRRCAALAAVGALVLAACGGGSEGSSSANSAGVTEQSTGAITDPAPDGPAIDEPGLDPAPVRLVSPGDPQYIRAEELATILIAARGSDEAAATALLRSFELGHDVDQVLAAVEGGALDAAGIIEGVAPASPPLGRIVGLRRVEPARPLPIEQLRQVAVTVGASFDFPVGKHATTGLLVLLGEGKPMSEIIEALVFGELTYVRDGVCYVYVFGVRDGDRLCEPSGVPIDTAADDSAVVAQTTLAPQPVPVDEPNDGVYVGTITGLTSANGFVVGSTSASSISIDLSGEVPEITLTYKVRLAPDNYAEDADVVCQVDLDFAVTATPLAGATANGAGWSGQLPVSLGVLDGTCPAGSTDNATLVGPLDVSFTFTESTVSGTLEGGGDVLSFGGSSVS